MGGLDKWLVYTWTSSPYFYRRSNIDADYRVSIFIHSISESAGG